MSAEIKMPKRSPTMQKLKTQPFHSNPGHLEGTLGTILSQQHNMNLRIIRGSQNIGPTYTHKIQVVVCNTQFKTKTRPDCLIIYGKILIIKKFNLITLKGTGIF